LSYGCKLFNLFLWSRLRRLALVANHVFLVGYKFGYKSTEFFGCGFLGQRTSCTQIVTTNAHEKNPAFGAGFFISP